MKLEDKAECSTILYSDNLVISCSKNKDNIIFYRKYEFQTAMIDINIFKSSLRASKAPTATQDHNLMAKQLTYKMEVLSPTSGGKNKEVIMIENDQYKNMVIQTLLQAIHESTGKFSKIELKQGGTKRRFPLETRIRLTGPNFNLILNGIESFGSNSWALEPRFGSWVQMTYKGSSSHRDVSEIARTSSTRLLEQSGGSPSELKNTLSVPNTFIKSSKLHIADLRQVGKRAIIVVSNMQTKGVAVFQRYIASLHGDKDADKALEVKEIKLNGANFKGYVMSSAISWTPEIARVCTVSF